MNTTELRFASNRVRDVERLFHKELDTQYGEGEVRSFLRLLFEAYLGWGETELLMRRDETVNQSDLLRFHWAVEDLKRFRPIQHIIGHVDFCDCRIDVDSTTLIPRPETEEIVLNLFEKLADKPPRRVLDLCTGSGCIAIAIAKRWPEAEVSAVDVSSGALAKARHNAIVNNVEVAFMQMDLLNDDGQDVFETYDLIISNPPYIVESEKEDMQRNVLDWEPESALFVPNDDPL
nr:peptide chain release factor N(5)-glutamine methyltransferase [Bacteroidales bacterium]